MFKNIDVTKQADVDTLMLELDGTENKCNGSCFYSPCFFVHIHSVICSHFFFTDCLYSYIHAISIILLALKLQMVAEIIELY